MREIVIAFLYVAQCYRMNHRVFKTKTPAIFFRHFPALRSIALARRLRGFFIRNHWRIFGNTVLILHPELVQVIHFEITFGYEH